MQLITTGINHMSASLSSYYLWGKLTYQKGKPVFQPVSNYSSGNLISAIGANALALIRVNQTYVPSGDEVIVMII